MIAGLVIHLSPDERLASSAIDAMKSQPTMQIGERHGRKLPVVLDTPHASSARDLTDWLLALAGVIHVDITSVHFEDEAASDVEVEYEQP